MCAHGDGRTSKRVCKWLGENGHTRKNPLVQKPRVEFQPMNAEEEEVCTNLTPRNKSLAERGDRTHADSDQLATKPATSPPPFETRKRNINTCTVLQIFLIMKGYHCHLLLCLAIWMSLYQATQSVFQESIFIVTASNATHNCRPVDGAEIARDVTSRSLLDCGRSCVNMEKCEMLAYSEQQGVCLFYHHHWKSDLCDVKGDWMMMTKGEANLTMTVCLNGGDVKEDGVSCQCYHGYVGDRCQRVMEDCYEGKMSGHYPRLGSGDQAVLWAQPRSMEQPVQVRCQDNANTIIQRRSSPSVDFNRTWQEYEEGFGKVGQDFWMGLRNMYLFTNARQYDLVFYFILKNGTTRYFIFKDFRITENTTYTASLGAYEYVQNQIINGRPVEEMSGKPFSTYDNDNDNAVNVNCGERFGGGWWFNACSELNANGRLVTTGVWSGEKEEVHYQRLGNNAPIYMDLKLKIQQP